MIRREAYKILLCFIVLVLSACSSNPVDRVLVKKSENKMYLLKYGEIVKTYDVSLGQNPVGHKVKKGDFRTPEGEYTLFFKNDKSKFYKSIKLNYPNEEDIERAEYMGVDPGGDIVIHGLPNEIGNYMGPFEPLNWTEGCIAVRNHEMDEIWELVALDTPIEIRP